MTTFFFDNTLSPKFPRMLNALGVDTTALSEHVPQNTLDEDWLPQLRGTEWVMITGDAKILTRPGEMAALIACGATALFLFPAFSRWGLWKQAGWLITHWPTIDAFIRQAQQGTIARIGQNGAAQVYTPRPFR